MQHQCACGCGQFVTTEAHTPLEIAVVELLNARDVFALSLSRSSENQKAARERLSKAWASLEKLAKP